MEEIKNIEQVAATPAPKRVWKKPAPKVEAAPTVIKDLNQDMPRQLSYEERRRQQEDEVKSRLRREWEVESQKVTGVFRDLEVGAGGHLRFSARKYKWDPVENFEFHDGCTYTVPLWVAKHLNENCKHPVYKHNIDPNAKVGEKVQQYVNAWNHRFAFVSSDYMGLTKPEARPITMVGNE